MRSPVRLLLLTLAVVMAAAGTAHAALIGPDIELPTFTRAQAGGGNAGPGDVQLHPDELPAPDGGRPAGHHRRTPSTEGC